MLTWARGSSCSVSKPCSCSCSCSPHGGGRERALRRRGGAAAQTRRRKCKTGGGGRVAGCAASPSSGYLVLRLVRAASRRQGLVPRARARRRGAAPVGALPPRGARGVLVRAVRARRHRLGGSWCKARARRVRSRLPRDGRPILATAVMRAAGVHAAPAAPTFSLGGLRRCEPSFSAWFLGRAR